MNGKGGKVPLSVARHSAYNAIALEQIKNELQPYETSQQALGGGGGGQVSEPAPAVLLPLPHSRANPIPHFDPLAFQLVAPLKRKPSIEKDAPQSPLHMQRTSPALDSGAGSSRSNSPHSQQPFSAAHVVGRSGGKSGTVKQQERTHCETVCGSEAIALVCGILFSSRSPHTGRQ